MDFKLDYVAIRIVCEDRRKVKCIQHGIACMQVIRVTTGNQFEIWDWE